jgi:hypothetical protein
MGKKAVTGPQKRKGGSLLPEYHNFDRGYFLRSTPRIMKLQATILSLFLVFMVSNAATIRGLDSERELVDAKKKAVKKPKVVKKKVVKKPKAKKTL